MVTDLLILRRHEPGRSPDPVRWERAPLTVIDGQQVAVNEYFLAHPDAVLGQFGTVHGAYRADNLVVTAVPGADLAASLNAALSSITASAQARGLTWTPAPAQAAQPPRSQVSAHPDGYLEADQRGEFTKVINGRPEQVTVPRTQAGELRALLALRTRRSRCWTPRPPPRWPPGRSSGWTLSRTGSTTTTCGCTGR
ncbi:MAG TPA: hypothetical protein VFQ44_10890 [Streptosporangiaceae bacterium]|nr:hypothetical protein [Streptosporangiaceae bacterium]